MGDFLLSVRRGIKSAILSNEADPILEEIGRYAAVESAGKLARPRLVHAFGRAVGLSEQQAEPIAVATELIHVASLLHDDIVDEAELRRGKKTTNRLWGNAATVLGGDFLLCRAFRAVDDDPALAARSVQVVEEMSSAAVAEVSARAEARLGRLFDAATCRRITRGKTAALFGWCGWAPATRAGAPDDATAFEAVARHLGAAFQYADDVHDFTIATGGERPLSDLRTRNPNLVIAHAAERDPTCAERLRWLWVQEELTEASVARIAASILATDAVAVALSEVDGELDAAARAARPFADRPGFEEIEAWIAWARAWKAEADHSRNGGDHVAAR